MEEFNFAQLVETIEPRGKPNPNPIAVLSIKDYKWNFELPLIKVRMLTTYIGLPTSQNKDPGGNVVWTPLNKGPGDLGWFHLKVIDQLIMHWVSIFHTDFLELTVFVEIPEDKVEEVNLLSDSITYDFSTGALTGRCHFIGAAIASIYLAMKLGAGKTTLREALRQYGSMISSTVHPVIGNEMFEEFFRLVGITPIYDGINIPSAIIP